MGLGIAATTTVFTVVDSVLLQPLPFAEPDRLVALWDHNAEKGLDEEPLSPVNFMDQRDLDVFADAAAGLACLPAVLWAMRVAPVEGLRAE